MAYIIGVIVWGLIWGYATKTVNENKGYYGGFWLGFFLGFIGLIIVACKSENRSSNNYTESYTQNSMLSEASSEASNKKTIAQGGWKCNNCGRVNQSYTGTCACGTSKSDNIAKEKAAAEEANELQNLQKLKAYKDLLDAGAISQKEFDEKKSELLK